MRHFIFLFFFSLTLSFWGQHTVTERLKHFNLENKIALQGYDPVAYFNVGKATKGSPKINSTYLGVTYFFYSENNKKHFETNPSKYEPQFGGWCAYAMGYNGEKVGIDPETFKIIDKKLYLFYNSFFNNTLKSWNKDEKNLKAKAIKNWVNFLNN